MARRPAVSTMSTSRPEAPRLAQAACGHGHGIGRLAEDRHAGLLPEDAQLLHRRGALQVGAHEQGVAPLLAEPPRQLGRRGGLARSLQAGEQDHRGGADA